MINNLNEMIKFMKAYEGIQMKVSFDSITKMIELINEGKYTEAITCLTEANE